MTDQPVITTAENTPLVLVDRRVNPVFATTSARDVAITAPDHGMECYVTANKQKYIYDGTRWIGSTWRSHHFENTQTLNNTATVTSLTDGTIELEANSVYDVYISLMVQSHTTAGIRWNFDGPTGATGVYRCYLYDQLILNSAQYYSDRWFGISGGAGIDRGFVVVDNNEKTLEFKGTVSTTVAGTFQMKLAQQTAQVQNLKVFGFTEATPQGVSVIRSLKVR